MLIRGFFPLTTAVLLIGIAQILILPPFEGFDETAHYSYVLEIADTRAVPVFGRSTIAKVVQDYHRWGPMPYTSVPPFNENGGWTYRTFSADPGAQEAYRQRYRLSDLSARRYEPSSEMNWEAQHPPLYYALLAPIMWATNGLPFNGQFFVLRLASYLLAVFGLLIGLYGTLRFFQAGIASSGRFMAGALLYPFLVPMFVPEFGRIGNDSLCTFLVGVAWTALLALVEQPQRKHLSVVLGFVLGLGLLTKALFLPIAAGVCVYLLYRSLALRTDETLMKTRVRQALTVTAIACATGGWWYAYKFFAFNSITGAAELINLDAQGGLLVNLQEKFEIRHLARGVAALIASGYYTGTWSLTRLPEASYLPGLLLLAILAARCFERLRRVRFTEREWAPLWMALPVAAGFLYFTFARIALSGSGNSLGGWYFHVLSPVFAVLVGLGLTRPISSRTARWTMTVLAAYALVFFMAGQWAQTTLYSGCAIKTADSKYYVFTHGAFCLTRLSDIVMTLGVIGWPRLAAACFVAAILCLARGLILVAPHQWLFVDGDLPAQPI